MAASESKDVCGVSVPKGGALDEKGGIRGLHEGGEYVALVLKSSASEAQKVDALQAAGIQSAKDVDLLGKGLTGGEVKVLAAAMEGSHTLTFVSFRVNPIGDTGVEAVVRMATTTPTLKSLDLYGCALTAAGAKYLASWLAGNPPLETLWISRNPDIGDAGLAAVAEGLQSNSNLTTVELDDCGMTAKSAAAWADLLRSCTALRKVQFGGVLTGDDQVTMLADAARAHCLLAVLGFRSTKMTDGGMRAVADMAADHPSLEQLHLYGNRDVTNAGWAAVSAGVRRNRNLALKMLYGMDLAKYDGTPPAYIVRDNDQWYGNTALLSHYRAQARIRRRVAAVAVLRTAWRRSRGQPVRDTADDKAQSTRAAELAHMVQLRRVCRVREGKTEVVEPFGRCVVAFL